MNKHVAEAAFTSVRIVTAIIVFVVAAMLVATLLFVNVYAGFTAAAVALWGLFFLVGLDWRMRKDHIERNK